MRKILLFAMIAIAACRTLPQQVADNNSVATTEAAAFLDELEREVMAKYATDSQVDQAELEALFKSLKNHYDKAYEARKVVSAYLASQKGDVDAAEGYSTATVLYEDIGSMSIMIFLLWDDWVSTTPNPELGDKEAFKNALEDNINRYKVLDSKFQEWVKQFKVK